MAYVMRARIEDPRTGMVHDYTGKGSADMLAAGVAGWNGDAVSLAHAMSTSEKRLDACEGRSVIIAVPHELAVPQAAELVASWCHDINTRHEVACAWVLHAPDPDGDARNIHAHVLVSGRRSDGENLGKKARELDDRKSGPAMIELWRAAWGKRSEEALHAANRFARVDMRSWARRLTADGLPVELIEGDEHLGPARTAIERQGRPTAAGGRNRRRRRHRRMALGLLDERAAAGAEDGRKARTRTSAMEREPQEKSKTAVPNRKGAPGGGGEAAKGRKAVRAVDRVIGGLLDEVARSARGRDDER